METVYFMSPPRAAEPSALLSLDDEPWRPSPRLFRLAVGIAGVAPWIVHHKLMARSAGIRWFETFPGEHYHLLTALAAILEPRVIWEFGTDTGMSAVALIEGYSAARLYTVDLVDWTTRPQAWLTAEDDQVTQIVANMGAPWLFERWGAELAEAELVVVDGPKDGSTEASFLELLAAVPFRRNPIVVFDDIRVANMLYVWRGIRRSKMDLTSFGHFTGTGLVDWKEVE